MEQYNKPSEEENKKEVIGTTTDNAHLPWVKLMVPHWNKLPFTIPHGSIDTNTQKMDRNRGGLAAVLMVAIFLYCLFNASLSKTLGVAILLPTFWVIMFMHLLQRPVSYSLEFLTDEVIYERKVIHKRKTSSPNVIRVHIPYESIVKMHSMWRGVSIQVKNGSEWVDHQDKSHKVLMIDKQVRNFKQITAFIKEVVNANRSQKL